MSQVLCSARTHGPATESARRRIAHTGALAPVATLPHSRVQEHAIRGPFTRTASIIAPTLLYRIFRAAVQVEQRSFE